MPTEGLVPYDVKVYEEKFPETMDLAEFAVDLVDRVISAYLDDGKISRVEALSIITGQLVDEDTSAAVAGSTEVLAELKAAKNAAEGVGLGIAVQMKIQSLLAKYSHI